MNSVIAVLFDPSEGYYSQKMIDGINRATIDLGIKALFFAGSQLNSPIGHNHQNNIIFDLCTTHRINGIIFIGSIAAYLSKNEIRDFLKHFDKIPSVVISGQWENHPAVLCDNKSGLENLINHLINDHHYKKIAFIRGTANSVDAQTRFEVYKSCLKKAGIAYDPSLVGDGEFRNTMAVRAFSQIYDRYREELEAVVCANDDMAMGVMSFAEYKGLKIPGDFAVTGFDNTDESQVVSPSLSTVSQPVLQIAHEAVGLLWNLINVNKVDGLTLVPAVPVLRRSCGCKEFQESRALQKNRKKVNEEMVLQVFKRLGSSSFRSRDLKAILDHLASDLEAKHLSDDFKIKVQSFVNRLFRNSHMENSVLDFLNLLENYCLDLTTQKDIIQELKIIFLQLNKIAESHFHNQVLVRELKLRYETDLFDNLSFKLMESQDMTSLGQALLTNLEALGINLFLYFEFKKVIFNYKSTDPETGNTPVRLVFSMVGLRKRITPESDTYFLAKEIHQNFEELFSTNAHSLLLLPICNGKEHYGYIITNAVPRLTKAFFNLKYQMGSAIRKIHMLREISGLDKLKNDFIANITHDFKSPLTVIINSADLALDYSNNLDQDSRESFELIIEAADQLKISIDRLLELARMDTKGVKLEISQFNLTPFLARFYYFYKSALSKTGIHLEKAFSDDEEKLIYCDEQKLEQVFLNLFSNAIKFVDSETGRIRLSIDENDEHMIINIEDNGIGIPADKIDRIFNRFEQASQYYRKKIKGTGIGLAFAKQLMDFLKGSIKVVSEGPGKGSCFSIILQKGRQHYEDELIVDRAEAFSAIPGYTPEFPNLPASPKAKEASRYIIEELNSEKEFSLSKAIIMIVEDEKIIRDILLSYLKHFGYRNFIVVSNGSEALEAVNKYQPDLIISDYNMPVMSGEQLLDELKENIRLSEVPFIFISAISDKKTIIQERKKGALAFLQKPIDKDELQLVVDQWLKNYFQQQQMKQLTIIDTLTGLFNRGHIFQELKQIMSRRQLDPISVIFCDIDFFQGLVNSHGSVKGNEILIEFSDVLKKHLRVGDLLGRIGDKEFLIILPDTTLSQAEKAAEKIQNTIANRENKSSLDFTVSFGIASLIDNSAAICRELNLTSLDDVYSQASSHKGNLKNRNHIKNIMADILVRLANEALNQAKNNLCQNCGYSSPDKNLPKNKGCPRCGSEEITKGYDSIKLSPTE